MPAEQFNLPFHKPSTSDRSPDHSTGPSDESSDAVHEDGTVPSSESESRLRFIIQQTLNTYEDKCEDAYDKSGGPHPHDMLAALDDLIGTLQNNLPNNILSRYTEQFKAMRAQPLEQNPVRELVQTILQEL